MKCRICETDCKLFLDLGRQPIANHFLSREEFDDESFYNLEVYFCPECLAVQIGECPDSSDVFNDNYSFFTGTSARMREHFAGLATLIKERYLPANGCIMEIGSNDGTFLGHFRDNVHLGFDPSGSVNEVAKSKGLRVFPFPFESFGEGIMGAWPKTDVFVSANSFAHIPDRGGVLRNIKRMLAPDGVWIDEEPYLGNIISRLAYDQFYNEHIFYTSIASMRNVLRMHDLDILDFEFIWSHGGSIRYFVGHRGPPALKVEAAIKGEGLGTFEVFDHFGRDVKKHAAKFKRDLAGLKTPAVGYAATAKSTTVLNFCDIGADIVSRIYDTTPMKQGKYSPGKHIPIVPHGQFKEDNPLDVVLFAWNHAEEIIAKESGIKRNWHVPVAGGLDA